MSWAFNGAALFVLAEVIWFFWGYCSLGGFGFGGCMVWIGFFLVGWVF